MEQWKCILSTEKASSTKYISHENNSFIQYNSWVNHNSTQRRRLLAMKKIMEAAGAPVFLTWQECNQKAPDPSLQLSCGVDEREVCEETRNRYSIVSNSNLFQHSDTIPKPLLDFLCFSAIFLKRIHSYTRYRKLHSTEKTAKKYKKPRKKQQQSTNWPSGRSALCRPRPPPGPGPPLGWWCSLAPSRDEARLFDPA